MNPFSRVTVAAAMTVATLGMALPVYARSSTGTFRRSRTVTVSARNMKSYKIRVRKHGKAHGPEIAGPDAPQAGACLPPILGFGREDLCLAFPVTVEVLQLEAGARQTGTRRPTISSSRRKSACLPDQPVSISTSRWSD